MSEQQRPMPDTDQWPAFVVPWDDNSSGPSDVSFLLHQPAGKFGFVKAQDSHLANNAGRWRIWGNNITAGACVPPKELAPTIARRAARLGINCIRFHFMDLRFPHGIIIRQSDVPADPEHISRHGPRDTESTRSLDPEGMDRLDYFIYCLKQNGVYSDLNLNVARKFTAGDGVKQAEWTGYAKALTYFDPLLIRLQKEYAQQLLGHVNAYTGLAYADEPAVALVELVNENSIVEAWLMGRLKGEQTEPFGTWGDIPLEYAQDLDALWNTHLADTFANREALDQAWSGDLKADEDPAMGSVQRLRPEQMPQASEERFRTEASFYADMERAWFIEIRDFLQHEVGIKQLILGSSDHNHGIHNELHVANNAVLDVIDGHCYWQHPRYGSGGYSISNWMITNTAMVDAPDHSAVAQLSRSRVEGKPYMVSEINEPFPNDYACEYWPIISTYAQLQDWDGIFFYNYVGGPTLEDWTKPMMSSFFFTAHEPVKTAQTAIGALTFLRGDVQPAKQSVPRQVNRTWLLDSLRRQPDDEHPYTLPWLEGRLSLVHRTGISSFEADQIGPQADELALPHDQIASDTGELIWHESAAPETAQVTVNTPRTQAVIGWSGPAETDNMLVEMQTPFCSVQLTSLTEAPIAQAAQLLLVTGARSANTGMRWDDASRTRLSDWGDAPMRIEPVTGSFALRGLEKAANVLLQPLDGRGQPACTPRDMVLTDGAWTITLTDEPATVWYAIEVVRTNQTAQEDV